MKALLLAATSSLALTGFAMAQTAAPAPAPATTTTTVADPVAAAGDKAEDADGRGGRVSSGPGWRGCRYASSPNPDERRDAERSTRGRCDG